MQFKNIKDDDHPTNMEPTNRLAHAYVPYQVLDNLYSPKEALCKGTLFPELWMPYQKS